MLGAWKTNRRIIHPFLFFFLVNLNVGKKWDRQEEVVQLNLPILLIGLYSVDICFPFLLFLEACIIFFFSEYKKNMKKNQTTLK